MHHRSGRRNAPGRQTYKHRSSRIVQKSADILSTQLNTKPMVKGMTFSSYHYLPIGIEVIEIAEFKEDNSGEKYIAIGGRPYTPVPTKLFGDTEALRYAYECYRHGSPGPLEFNTAMMEDLRQGLGNKWYWINKVAIDRYNNNGDEVQKSKLEKKKFDAYDIGLWALLLFTILVGITFLLSKIFPNAGK